MQSYDNEVRIRGYYIYICTCGDRYKTWESLIYCNTEQAPVPRQNKLLEWTSGLLGHACEGKDTVQPYSGGDANNEMN